MKRYRLITYTNCCNIIGHEDVSWQIIANNSIIAEFYDRDIAEHVLALLNEEVTINFLPIPQQTTHNLSKFK